MSQNMMLVEIKRHAVFFSRMELNYLTHIQPENLQDVQNIPFFRKAPGVNGLTLLRAFLFI